MIRPALKHRLIGMAMCTASAVLLLAVISNIVSWFIWCIT